MNFDNDSGALPVPPTRREFLARNALGIGTVALASLLDQESLLAKPPALRDRPPTDLLPRQPHFAPRANAMISLFMHGGPSHVDLLDPKPELSKGHGKDYSGPVTYSFVNRASRTVGSDRLRRPA